MADNIVRHYHRAFDIEDVQEIIDEANSQGYRLVSTATYGHDNYDLLMFFEKEE